MAKKENNMKKLLTVVVAVLMAATCMFGLTACNTQTVKIGAQQGTTGFTYASCLKGCVTSGYTTPANAVTDMKNGKIDYVIVDKATATNLENNIEGIKVIDIALTTEQYAIGVDKNQAELKTAIDGILTLRALEIQAIIAKYMAGDEDNYEIISGGTVDTANPAGQLVVATNAEFAPFEFVNGNGFSGIDIEIAKLIADSLNLELVIQDMKFEAVVSAVGKNNIDVAMAAMTVTAARKQSINFSNSYYTEAQVVVALESDTALDEAGTVVDVLAVLCAGAING